MFWFLFILVKINKWIISNYIIWMFLKITHRISLVIWTRNSKLVELVLNSWNLTLMGKDEFRNHFLIKVGDCLLIFPRMTVVRQEDFNLSFQLFFLHMWHKLSAIFPVLFIFCWLCKPRERIEKTWTDQ